MIRASAIILCLASLPVASINGQRLLPSQVVDSGARRPTRSVPKTPTGSDASPIVIPINHFQYNNGLPVTVRIGEPVVWVNYDPMQHSASSSGANPTFDTGLLQPGAASEPTVFLTETDSNGIQYHCNVHDGMAGIIIVHGKVADVDPIHNAIANETPSVHSMVVMGSRVLFFSHVALFNDYNHQYQVTLEGSLVDPAADHAYQLACGSIAGQLCVVDPEYFILRELQNGSRTSFHASFFKGAWDQPIAGLKNVEVRVHRIIQFRHFDPAAKYPTGLQYQLIGSGGDAFLVSQVTEAPNYQEVVQVSGDDALTSAQSLATNPIVTILGKDLNGAPPRVTKRAVLSDGTSILLSPAPGVVNPQEPLHQGEILTVVRQGETTPHHLIVRNLLFFDIRILNK